MFMWERVCHKKGKKKHVYDIDYKVFIMMS